ncbi:uncharacterized protein A4U43_C04F19970 [Asparagus officinalis]|uniref:AB hydrolase-1 domain-containing protein n=1 Tax=Asparagus officinalis TaxID=4686 RepID=A0A5P1F7L4_ASPOF|nr:salicylic acid-binding protein 2-like [Asparagus officinalis]ONK72490.1 uncharacterized protein A4U43_C04F19970 [Asparagus officinalis]
MAEPTENKRRIILVHGASHGAWSWYKLATLLKSAGHQVTIPDLKASGIDATRLEEVASFADYSQPLMDVVASLPSTEKVILVGHSLGGLSVALAAEKFPEKVAGLVFVTAIMPDCESSPGRLLKDLLFSPLFMSLDTQLTPIEAPTESKIPPPSRMIFGPQTIAYNLYQLCSQEDLMLASTLLRPCPMFLEDLESTSALSKDRYGSVPSFYVVCCDDAIIAKEYQQQMIRNHCVKKVFEIEGSDHMPMFSRPQELCQSLLEIVEHVDD